MRIKSAELKDFCSQFLKLSVFLWCSERLHIFILWVEWFREVELGNNWFGSIFVIFSFCNITKMFAEMVSKLCPCFSEV